MSPATTTADGPDLRWARAEAINEVVERVRKDLAASLIGAPAFAALSKQLRFRDSAGVYWAPGLTRSQWFQFTGSTWQMAGGPPSLLEGPATFDGYALRSIPRASTSRDEGPSAGSVDPVMGIDQLTRSRVTDYQTGALSSHILQSLLSSIYLLDREGFAWRLGVRSGRWYRWDRGWQQVGAAPDPTTLMGPEVRKRLASPAAGSAPASTCPNCHAPTTGTAFCTSCGTRITAQAPIDPALKARVEAFDSSGKSILPEAVVDAWNPPAGDPEQALTCPSCQTVNEAGAQRCRHCGRAFVQANGAPGGNQRPGTPPAHAMQAGFSAPPMQPASRPSHCGNCGRPLPPNVKFCVSCGTRVPA